MAGAPLLGGLFFVVAVTLVGLPPLSGFLGKFMLLRAALESPLLPWVWATVLVTSLVSLVALARTGTLLFYRTHGSQPSAAAETPTLATAAPIAGLVVLVIGLVAGAGPLSDYAAATASQLLQPGLYVGAVLGGAR
jgi:multicomponent K+:H+ antiporter subunit D